MTKCDILIKELNNSIKEICNNIDFEVLLYKHKLHTGNVLIRPDKEIVESILKTRNYTKTNFGWIKGFIHCVVKSDDVNIKSIEIRHDIKGSKSYVMNDSFITGLEIALKYFERL